MIMIRGLFLLIVGTLSLISSSAKEDLTNPTFRSFPFPLNIPSAVYTSDWETVPGWQLAEGPGSLLFTFSRSLEQVSSSDLKEGVVVVFAKGYDFEKVSAAEEKPLGLPFYMTLANETALHPYAWSYSSEEKRVTIGLSMDSSLKPGFEQAQSDIRIRFFVLTPDFLQQHKLTAMAVRKMPYGQLVALLNIAP